MFTSRSARQPENESNLTETYLDPRVHHETPWDASEQWIMSQYTPR